MKFIFSLVFILLLAMSSMSSMSSATTNNTVWLANTPILTIRNGAGKLTITERVNIIQSRMNDILTRDTDMLVLTIVQSGNDSNILSNDKLLMTVTEQDATSNDTAKSSDLAIVWSKSIIKTVVEVISLYRNWL